MYSYCSLNYEVAFALVFLCAGAHKLGSAFLLEVINSCIILAREFCACCALNTLKVPTRYRHAKNNARAPHVRNRLRNNGDPALMGAFCGGGIVGGRARSRKTKRGSGKCKFILVPSYKTTHFAPLQLVFTFHDDNLFRSLLFDGVDADGLMCLCG